MAVKLGSVKKAPDTKKGKQYPVLATMTAVVDSLVEKARRAKVIEGEINTLKAEVAEAALPVAIAHIKKGGEELGVSVTGTDGSVLVVYKDDFRSGVDLEEVSSAVGAKVAKALLRQRFSLSVSGDTLVSVLGDAGTTKFVEKLSKLFSDHGVDEALTAKEDYVPTGVADVFKTLSVEQITALNESKTLKVPTTVSVK